MGELDPSKTSIKGHTYSKVYMQVSWTFDESIAC